MASAATTKFTAARLAVTVVLLLTGSRAFDVAAENHSADGAKCVVSLLQVQASKLHHSDEDSVSKPAGVSSQRGIILRYMPEHNVAVCACAKCGSTSLWQWMFKNEFHHDWLDGHGVDVQDVTAEPWQHKFIVTKDSHSQDKLMETAFTFALIRDPKERLISAWKSKIACGEKRLYGTDIPARAGIVGSLLKVWGEKKAGHKKAGHVSEECMHLKRFVEVLRDVHRDGNEGDLNGHFMPQDKACFGHAPPNKWSQVVDIADPNFATLAQHIHAKGAPEHTHASTRTVFVDEEVNAMLDEITAKEYGVLAEYLSRPSKVGFGIEALEHTMVDQRIRADPLGPPPGA